MQNMILGQMNKLIIHFVGNKNNGDGVRFSNILTNYENIEPHVKNLIKNSFKSDELFQFYFLPTLDLNPVFQFVSSIFDNNETFVQQTQNCARYLYDKSVHPQIKEGELCVTYFENCQIDRKIVDCIGLFKSENKDTILKISPSKDGFDLTDEKGININKLDKGCLVFNLQKENGFLVATVDNTNRSTEAQYWKDEFLSIQPMKDEFHQTNQFLGIAKQFVTKQLTEDFEVSKADKIDFLNRSVDYFKTHETFDKQEFEETVFADSGVIESFRKFDQTFRQENEIEISDSFDISPQAVKKQARAFKSVLKLDKNFLIHINGDRDLIEQGVEKDGRKYYKIYYQDES